MAQATLAGFNVDIEALREAERLGVTVLTPETLSAAYARISRDPRAVAELRAQARADVKRARESNQRIVFEFGHHSVAEHAVFNFDITGASRLLVELIESHRLASYTEKSQRYIRIGEDFIIPQEVKELGLDTEFCAYLQRCFRRYQDALARLEQKGIPARVAGEDARYFLPLATTAQLGMTVNARTLEYMLLRLSASAIAEARALAAQLLEEARRVAPSLLLFVEPSTYHTDRARRVREAANALLGQSAAQGPDGHVRLLNATSQGDERILAALVAAATGSDYAAIFSALCSAPLQEKQRIFEAATAGLSVHDALPREFEHATLTFELVVSAAAFAQLKRHRMATLTPGPYEPALGVTVPSAFYEAGVEALMGEAEADALQIWAKIQALRPEAAPYVCLNAHRRRVVVTMNLRELYHFSRLRESKHAQWDIRALAKAMATLARQAFPVCASLLGAKEEVADRLTLKAV